MSGFNWDKARFRRKPTEQANPREELTRGPWTHNKRSPVRHLTSAEISEYEAQNLDDGRSPGPNSAGKRKGRKAR